MARVQVILAAVFLVAAIVIWFVFLRQVPVKTAVGTITGKAFREAGEYVQYPVGSRSSFRTATSIPIAEHYVLEIRVDGHSADLLHALNTSAAERFEVGDQVSIEYQERGLPPFWQRSYVTEVKPR